MAGEAAADSVLYRRFFIPRGYLHSSIHPSGSDSEESPQNNYKTDVTH
jgi:hypothetical protein